MKNKFWLTLALLGGFSAEALPKKFAAKKTAPTPSSSDGFNYLSARAGDVQFFQKDGAFNTLFLDYTPAYNFGGGWGARVAIGGSFLKDIDRDVIWLFKVTALASYQIAPEFAVELGGGQYYFIRGGGARWQLSTNYVWIPSFNVLDVIDHFFLGYSTIFVPRRLTHEVRLGAGWGW